MMDFDDKACGVESEVACFATCIPLSMFRAGTSSQMPVFCLLFKKNQNAKVLKKPSEIFSGFSSLQSSGISANLNFTIIWL
jgi:hypothetical protein